MTTPSDWSKAVAMSEAGRRRVGLYNLGGLSVLGYYDQFGDKGLYALTADPTLTDMPEPYTHPPRAEDDGLPWGF